MKTYVICIDGTWNKPGQKDKGPGIEDVERETETNVLRIFRFLTGRWPKYSMEEKVGIHGMIVPVIQPLDARYFSGEGYALYLAGVGSSGNFFQQRWEGATGTGTSERIKEAYQFLAERHEPGDQIFAFGFSRGAFAVRSLAGFLQFAGLPENRRTLSEDEVDKIYETYRKRASSIKSSRHGRSVEVDFLGIWDTVGALAFGAPIARWHLISPNNVKRVAHALALDERRSRFAPEYWEGNSTTSLIEEVWFSGAHTNVGGGYVEEGLSNIALAWVVSKAVEAGLRADKGYIRGWEGENFSGTLRNSLEEYFSPLGVFHPILVESMSRTIRQNQRIHTNVCDRVKYQKNPCYTPAATLHGDKAFPSREELIKENRLVDTPDYLGY